MVHGDSVTEWLVDLRNGDQSAAQQLWDRYFRHLAALADKRLRTRPVPADGEDIALSAMHSLWKGVQRGRFADLSDREGLWKLLVAITVRKANHAVRDEFRQKRGGGRVIDQAGLAQNSAADDGAGALELALGREPTPEFAAQMEEEMQRLLDILPDDELRDVAIWKMNGLTSAEIADKIGKALTTVERRLRLIRTYWAESVPE
ncbi:MAG: ECF-type sigma factor [Planctomycetaceae bacterium]